MPDFKPGDRVRPTPNAVAGSPIAAKVIAHHEWSPLFSTWVQVTHGNAHFNPGVVFWFFDEDLEHID